GQGRRQGGVDQDVDGLAHREVGPGRQHSLAELHRLGRHQPDRPGPQHQPPRDPGQAHLNDLPTNDGAQWTPPMARFRLLLLAAAGAAASLPVRGEDKDSHPLAALQAISPSFRGQALEVKGYRVFEWVLGPKRQRVRKPVAAAALYAFGPTYYVE